MIKGFLFGWLFILTGWAFDFYVYDLAVSLSSLITIHQKNSLHYIIETAPLILGATGFRIDRYQERLNDVAKQLVIESKYSNLILNSTGKAIFGVDLNGNFTFVNNRCLELLGYQSDSQLIGQNMHLSLQNTYQDGSIYPIEKSKVLRVLQTKKIFSSDDEFFTRADGRYILVNYRSAPMFREGHLVGLVVAFNDISDISRQKIQYQKLLNTMFEGMIVTDDEGYIETFNIAAERIFDYPSEQIHGKHLDRLIEKSDHEVYHNLIKSFLLGNMEVANNFSAVELTGVRSDGKHFPMHFGVSQLKFGAQIQYSFIIRDLTEEKKRLAENKRMADELVNLIDNVNVPIMGVDITGEINEWNIAATELTDYTKDEILEPVDDEFKFWIDKLIAPHQRDFLKKAFKMALLGVEELSEYEASIIRKDGSYREMMLNLTTRREISGKIVGVLCVGQDVTEHKRVLAQAIYASKLSTLGEMSTGVAHELNQPLNIIRMATANMLRKNTKGVLEPEYLDKKLNRVVEQTERAAAIINHMRMFGRSDSSAMTQIKLERSINNAYKLLKDQLYNDGIEVEFELAENCPAVIGDSIKMEQVLINLLNNSQYVLTNREQLTEKIIRICLKKEGSDLVQLTVSDTGGGIEEESIDRIFEPFFTTKDVGKGVGLGLSVVYGIITEMDGTIRAENTADGSKFTINLPVAKKKAG